MTNGLRALAALCRCGRSSAQHPRHDGRRIRLARRGEVIGLSEPVRNLAQGRRPPLLARKNRTLAFLSKAQREVWVIAPLSRA